MHTRTTPLMFSLLALAALPAAHAAVDVTDGGFVYSQDFDSLAQSGGSNVWVNDGTLAGWSLFDAHGQAVATYAGDNGSSNAGAFKAYGDTGSAERALGGLGSGGSYFGSPASGDVAGWITLSFTNLSGAALAGFTLAFDGEQWRNGNASTQTMVLDWGFGTTFADVTDWQSAGAGFDWDAPVFGGSAGAVDGNGAGQVTGLGGSIATAWGNGETLWLRWTERNDVGSDHGLAIDNLQFSVSPVPEPGSLALWLAGLGLVGFVARRRA